VTAVQHFNGSDFSLPVPIPGQLVEAIEAFEPDVVHAHHPFLLGDTAARAADTYAEAFGSNEEFFSLYRSLNAYRKSFEGENNVMILAPDSKFFKYLNDPSPR